MTAESSDSNTAAPSTTATAQEWTPFITPFAQAIGKTPEEATASLRALVDPNQSGIDELRSEEIVSFDEIAALFSDIKKPKLRLAVKTHLRVTAAAPGMTTPVLSSASLDLLPQVPDEQAWLQALRTGGELKVNQTSVIAALRAALASRTGLFDLPKVIIQRMEEQARSLEQPVGADFYKLRKLLTQHTYAEIFSALEIEGSFMSQGRKDDLLERLDATIWPSLASFQRQLSGWVDTWQKGIGSPGMLMMAMAGGFNGTAGAVPPGMMQPPDTNALRDASEGVVNDINKVFAGLGIPVSMALAYDAMRIKEVLENPSLPIQIGAANREQMLKLLGVSVSADYVRIERSVTRYALAVIDYPRTVVGGQQELQYLGTLWSLGTQIDWALLEQPTRGNALRRAVSGNDRSPVRDTTR